jgi:uncharacterized protein YxeA
VKQLLASLLTVALAAGLGLGVVGCSKKDEKKTETKTEKTETKTETKTKDATPPAKDDKTPTPPAK